jgi:hypothetical protein
MFILLGASDDPCLAAVARALAERSCEALILTSPFMAPACTAWRFDSTESETTLTVGGRPIAIDAVLASRRTVQPLPQAEQWSTADLLYNQAETEAALLGWLSGLRCPVIDRLPAWLSYRTRRPVIAWASLLRRSGLPPLDSIVSGDAGALARFLKQQGGAAMESIAGGPRQLVADNEAATIFETAPMAPVRLTKLHHGAWRACLAGTRLVWDDGTPRAANELSPRLRAFAAAAGLSFAEFIVTAGDPPRMVDIETRPGFELFGPEAQRAIADGLVEALTQAGQARAADQTFARALP